MQQKIFLELSPPPRRVSQAVLEKNLAKIESAVSKIPNISHINIPEVIEENRQGAPLYRNMDSREFGKILFSKFQIPIIVNKVTPHLSSIDELGNWVSESINTYGISSFVFVGGSHGHKDYPGPTVIEANKLAKSIENVTFGNISIPGRASEAQRLHSKTKYGCKFFTTQILFEAQSTKNLLAQYDAICKSENMPPSEFYLGFAPLANDFDLDFCKWLGVDVPKEVDLRLRESGEAIGETSIAIASQILADVLEFAKTNKISVPISINVEPLSLVNIDLGIKMANALQAELVKPG
ncbi:hypothetical protein HY989_04520 [Candidatus Micrarchaeota archaeon]|nr:hypothetical protein [Candidatus Micrarchaeota archaeon]